MSTMFMVSFGSALWLIGRRLVAHFASTTRTSFVLGWLVVIGLTGVTGFELGANLRAATLVVLFVGLVVLTEIDLRTRRLPREISYPLFAIALTLVTVDALLTGRGDRVVDALLGAIVTTGVLLTLHLASRGGMGDGDVRLAPVLGLFAVDGLDIVWAGLFVAFVSAGLTVAVLLTVGHATRTSTVPFGPFLAIGSITAALTSGVGS